MSEMLKTQVMVWRAHHNMLAKLPALTSYDISNLHHSNTCATQLENKQRVKTRLALQRLLAFKLKHIQQNCCGSLRLKQRCQSSPNK